MRSPDRKESKSLATLPLPLPPEYLAFGRLAYGNWNSGRRPAKLGQLGEKSRDEERRATGGN